ncbi:MAG: RNA polymerase sigma factor RpoH [Pseudomonadota bacterium]|nr:RNA polymerase sigma factor RpoH [Pseudomonadota bacterium]
MDLLNIMTNELIQKAPSGMALGIATGDSLDHYLSQLRNSSILSREEELELSKRFYNSNDLDAARKLVMSHLRFVVHIAKTYQGYGLPLLDLIQEGNIGLMKAVKKFDPNKKVRLLSFAIHWIRAEMHEFILKNWRIVKVATTKAQRKLFFKLRSKKNSNSWLTKTETENIADDLQVKPETVSVMESRLSGSDISFDPSDEDETSPSAYLSNNEDPSLFLEYESEGKTNNLKLYDAMSKLDPRSKDIIVQRYLQDEKTTLEDLSKKYNISKERIRQIEAKTLASLKQSILIA